jgi:hypothetical protein
MKKLMLFLLPLFMVACGEEVIVDPIPSQNKVWDLYVQIYSPMSGKPMYKIYGVSGDWTFGNAPTFYQQKLSGNKRAAKYVFDYFIKTFLNG